MAARLVGGGLSCGMTMQPSGRPVTVACSDQVAARVDEVQYELDDGPCLHAMRDGSVVRIEDTTEKARWPEFEAEAASHGIRSCLALPLNADGKPVGALNLYSRQASAFGSAEARRAENFAENASGALSLAMRLASHAALIEQLRFSLTSRTVIDQALGIIMAREQCNQARAFAILRSASQNSNVKLRDIARRGGDQRDRRAAAAGPAVRGRPALSAAVGIGLGRGTVRPGLVRLAGRPGQRRGDAGIYVHQPVDPGYREHPLDGRRADHEPHRRSAGVGVPEGAHQGAYPGRIAEIRFAHVRDQQCRALVQHGEEFLPDGVGIGHVYLRGQRDHGYLTDPQHRIALTRHVPPPSVHAKVSRPRLWT